MAEILEDVGADAQLPPFPNIFDGKGPSLEQILQMLEGMEGISDEEKEQLKTDLINRAFQDASKMFGAAAKNPQQLMGPQSYWVFFLMVLLLVLIFGKNLLEFLKKCDVELLNFCYYQLKFILKH